MMRNPSKKKGKIIFNLEVPSIPPFICGA